MTEESKPTIGKTVLEYAAMFAIVIAAVWGVKTFLVENYNIPSGSMIPTLAIGDYVMTEKVSYYSRSPLPGEIITFVDPDDSARTLIKRCIATEGQKVDLKDGHVYIDGVKQDEPYTHGKPSEPLVPTIEFPYTVPEGCIWVMGDNRTDSQDSRYFGAIPVSSVTGHAVFIYWPASEIGPI